MSVAAPAPLEVACTASGAGAWQITVSLNGKTLEQQTVSSLAEFTSQYVTITGSLPLQAFNVTLSGGTNGDATAASAQAGEITATALLPGTLGNRLAVSCTGEAAPYTITVTLDGAEVDQQSVATAEAFVSDWLTLSGTLEAFAATALSGGTDGTATAASGTLLTQATGLTVTALYPGARGNDVSVVATAQTEGGVQVSTVVDGEIVDQQTGTQVSDLVENAWVRFSGEGDIPTTVGVTLSGGADGQVQSAAYSRFLTAIEPYQFDILIYDGSDPTVQDAMVAFIKRIAEDSGVYAQLVSANMTNPDSRFVINVCSGVTLSDGTVLTPEQTTWWVGGVQAGAMYNQDLTYANYPSAVAVSPLLTDSGYRSAILAGQLVLFADDGQAKVEYDINSLVSYTPDVGEVFHFNRVMRLCNTIANDIFRQFSKNFIGTVNNNEEGRAMFKTAIVGYLLDIQANQGVQNFTADDVEVLPGTAIDAILVNIAIQAVGAVNKIYMTIDVS